MTEVRSQAGRYRRVRTIGAGGMGRVDLALREEARFRRFFAMKRLLRAYRADPVVRSMFLEEGHIGGLLRHPNVVSVLDVGEDDEGPFLVMDFVEGAALDRILADLEPGEALPLSVCIEVARQTAEGLRAIHELRDTRGFALHVVHRDVSPPNILVGFDSLVRLTDFGIARAPGFLSDPGTSRLVRGKLGYLSPEQVRSEALDARSDLFALGVVLYELLAGARLYAGDDPTEVRRRILREPAPDITEVRDDVHPALVQLLYELLAKDAAHRPVDAKSVASRLSAIGAEIATTGPGLALFMSTRFGHVRAGLARDLADAWVEVDARPAPPPRRAAPRATWAMFAVVAALIAASALAWYASAAVERAHHRVGSRNDVSSTP